MTQATRNSSLTPCDHAGQRVLLDPNFKAGMAAMTRCLRESGYAHAPMISGGRNPGRQGADVAVRSSSASQSTRPARRASVTTRPSFVGVERVASAAREAKRTGRTVGAASVGNRCASVFDDNPLGVLDQRQRRLSEADGFELLDQ